MMKRFISTSSILLLLLSACATGTLADYRSRYSGATFNSAIPYETLYQDLKGRMSRCYSQDGAIIDQRTESGVDSEHQVATIYYAVDAAFGGKNILYLLDITPTRTGSTVKLHAKGDLFRTTHELEENLSKWVKGEKGHCRGAGEV